MSQIEERGSAIPSFGAFWAALIFILIVVILIRFTQPSYSENNIAAENHNEQTQ